MTELGNLRPISQIHHSDGFGIQQIGNPTDFLLFHDLWSSIEMIVVVHGSLKSEHFQINVHYQNLNIHGLRSRIFPSESYWLDQNILIMQYFHVGFPPPHQPDTDQMRVGPFGTDPSGHLIPPVLHKTDFSSIHNVGLNYRKELLNKSLILAIFPRKFRILDRFSRYFHETFLLNLLTTFSLSKKNFSFPPDCHWISELRPVNISAMISVEAV